MKDPFEFLSNETMMKIVLSGSINLYQINRRFNDLINDDYF